MLGSRPRPRPRRRSVPNSLSAAIESLEDRTLLSGSGGGAVIGQAIIIDNGDAGFSQTGSRWGTSFNGGFAGDHQYNAAGNGSETAQWSFSVGPGTYQVAVTWLHGSNRATNAPFTIMDGANVLGTIAVNQETAPNDFTADGAGWRNLGEFVSTSGTLTVRLSNAANEFVVADAVRITRVQAGPEIEVTVGGNNLADNGSVDFGEMLIGGHSSRSFTITNSGVADLSIEEPPVLPDGFSFAEPFNLTTLAPGASATFTIQFSATALGNYSGEVSFVSNDMDESPFNFTVSATVSDALIVDDGDPGFTLSGSNWGKSNNGGYGGDHSYNAPGTGADAAEWTFQVGAGDYQVSTTWLAGVNRATDATFTVLDGTTVVGTIVLNQELAPDDFSANGSNWEILGEFTITSGTLTVRLNDAANEFVIGDAVRVAPVVPVVPEVSTNGGTTASGTGDSGTGDSGTGDADEDSRDGCRGFWGFRRGRDFTPPPRGRVIRNVVLPIIRDWFDNRPAVSSLGQKIAAAVRSIGNGRGR